MTALRSEVLRLYRSLLRESGKFSNYNFRMYALRRVKDEFHEHKLEADPKKIDGFISCANQNLEMIKRQVIVGNLYKTDNLVIEKNAA